MDIESEDEFDNNIKNAYNKKKAVKTKVVKTKEVKQKIAKPKVTRNYKLERENAAKKHLAQNTIGLSYII